MDPSSSEEKTRCTVYARNRQHVNIFDFVFGVFVAFVARKARRAFCDWVCGGKWFLILFGLEFFPSCLWHMKRAKRDVGFVNRCGIVLDFWFGLVWGFGRRLWRVKRDVGFGIRGLGGKWTPAPALAPNANN